MKRHTAARRTPRYESATGVQHPVTVSSREFERNAGGVEILYWPLGLQIPDTDRFIVCGREQVVAAGVKADVLDPVVVPFVFK